MEYNKQQAERELLADLLIEAGYAEDADRLFDGDCDLLELLSDATFHDFLRFMEPGSLKPTDVVILAEESR